MIIIIDACTQGSGGARRHLKEILNEFLKDEYKITGIFIWGPINLLKLLPNHSLITKKNFSIT